jgi:hypothetical protein
MPESAAANRRSQALTEGYDEVEDRLPAPQSAMLITLISAGLWIVILGAGGWLLA